MTAPRTTSVIIAESIYDSETSARYDWGWQLARDERGQKGAITPGGEFAVFVASADALRGLSPDWTIILGWNWDKVPYVAIALESHRARGGLVVHGADLR